jgi:probable phosphoglycerate mutase
MTSSKGGQLLLLFLRHGETKDNIERVLQGHRDTSLTENGLREAQVLANKLKDQHIDAIYHSPLTRMVQTIAPILEDRPYLQKFPDTDLKGQMLGELEGGAYDLVDLGNPRSADDKPGVEKFNDFVARLKRALTRIVGEQAPQVDGEDRVVAVATHGVCITSIFKCLENSPQCDGLNPKLARRGPEAYEVRWTDSDDIARLVVPEPAALPIKDGLVDWDKLEGEPFIIDRWGKKEKEMKAI